MEPMDDGRPCSNPQSPFYFYYFILSKTKFSYEKLSISKI